MGNTDAKAGGDQQMSWRLEFFDWLRWKIIFVEDWPYAGTYFIDDPDLPLLEGEDWDEDLGKNPFFKFYEYYDFFVYLCMF